MSESKAMAQRIETHHLAPNTPAFEEAVAQIFTENNVRPVVTETPAGTFFELEDLWPPAVRSDLCSGSFRVRYLLDVLLRAPHRGEAPHLIVAYEVSPAVKREWSLRGRQLAPRRLVGFLTYDLVAAAPASGDETKLRVTALCARPGTGRRLMCEAERAAHESGAALLTLSAVSTAIPFYRHLGFRNATQGCRDAAAIARAARLADAYIRASGARFEDAEQAETDAYYGPFLEALHEHGLRYSFSGLYPMRYCLRASRPSAICAPRRLPARSARPSAAPLAPAPRRRPEQGSEEEELEADEDDEEEEEEEAHELPYADLYLDTDSDS